MSKGSKPKGSTPKRPKNIWPTVTPKASKTYQSKPSLPQRKQGKSVKSEKPIYK